eukprot:EG_transcript_16649
MSLQAALHSLPPVPLRKDSKGGDVSIILRKDKSWTTYEGLSRLCRCIDWKTGERLERCLFGAACPHAHDFDELQEAPSLEMMTNSSRWVIVVCAAGHLRSKSVCVPPNAVYNTKIIRNREALRSVEEMEGFVLCRNHFFLGKCSYGNNCEFVHLDHRNTEVQRAFRSRFCMWGDKCCSLRLRGVRCLFAHTPAELTPPRDFRPAAGPRQGTLRLGADTVRFCHEDCFETQGMLKVDNRGPAIDLQHVCSDLLCDAWGDCLKIHFRWPFLRRFDAGVLPRHPYARLETWQRPRTSGDAGMSFVPSDEEFPPLPAPQSTPVPQPTTHLHAQVAPRRTSLALATAAAPPATRVPTALPSGRWHRKPVLRHG